MSVCPLESALCTQARAFMFNICDRVIGSLHIKSNSQDFRFGSRKLVKRQSNNMILHVTSNKPLS